MKTYRNLYPQLYRFGNLLLAFEKARKGKRSKFGVAAFEYDLERNLLQLESELFTEMYRLGWKHQIKTVSTLSGRVLRTSV